MAKAMPRLQLFEHEAEPDWDEDLTREEGPVLDDAQVERLLLGAPWQTRRDHDRGPVGVIGAAIEGDALQTARGVTIGLVWVLPLWCLIAAILVLI
jgi:hypothetical protein